MGYTITVGRFEFNALMIVVAFVGIVEIVVDVSNLSVFIIN